MTGRRLRRRPIGPPRPTPRRLAELEMIATEAQRLADEAPPLSRSQIERLRECGLDAGVR